MVAGFAGAWATHSSMLMEVRHSARWQFAAIVSLISLFLLAWPAAADLLIWKRVQIADGQAWRWISGHVVHFIPTLPE